MPAATIEINDHEILAALAQLERTVGYLEPALDEIGATIAASVMLNFTGQHDPDGNAWKPLSDATLANRRGGEGQILRDTGRLNRSITHNVTSQSVEIGSDIVYANMMQFGGKKADYPWLWGEIPERPFVGVSESDKAEILAILSNHLERSIR